MRCQGPLAAARLVVVCGGSSWVSADLDAHGPRFSLWTLAGRAAGLPFNSFAWGKGVS